MIFFYVFNGGQSLPHTHVHFNAKYTSILQRWAPLLLPIYHIEGAVSKNWLAVPTSGIPYSQIIKY